MFWNFLVWSLVQIQGWIQKNCCIIYLMLIERLYLFPWFCILLNLMLKSVASRLFISFLHVFVLGLEHSHSCCCISAANYQSISNPAQCETRFSVYPFSWSNLFSKCRCFSPLRTLSSSVGFYTLHIFSVNFNKGFYILCKPLDANLAWICFLSRC